jgi:hypothetical protein
MIRQVRQFIIPAAFSILPVQMDSIAAKAMLIAIGLQESKLTHRRQVEGPAKGLWQNEPNSIIALRTNSRTKAHVENVLSSLMYSTKLDAHQIYDICEHNDILSCSLARLLLWAIPTHLPAPGDFDQSWGQYLAAWNPGQPNRARWNLSYTMAWQEIQGASNKARRV